jgi:glycosyltransferase involved in cell wall biosynthesis
MQEYEKRIDRYNKIFVGSERDLQIVKETIPQAHIEVLDNGVDIDYYNPDISVKAELNRLIFTGNMAYYPNVDGVRYFVKYIFPLIRGAVPETELFIVGQSPPRTVRRLANDYITVTGFVPDIRIEYLRSCIAISPIRFGSGTLNKVLEPMALGIPVVATKVGVEGLGLSNGKEILITDDPKEFANKVIMLLRDPVLRKKIAEAGMKVIRNRFDWKRITKKLIEVEEEIVNSYLTNRKDRT